MKLQWAVVEADESGRFMRSEMQRYVDQYWTK